MFPVSVCGIQHLQPGKRPIQRIANGMDFGSELKRRKDCSQIRHARFNGSVPENRGAFFGIFLRPSGSWICNPQKSSAPTSVREKSNEIKLTIHFSYFFFLFTLVTPFLFRLPVLLGARLIVLHLPKPHCLILFCPATGGDAAGPNQTERTDEKANHLWRSDTKKKKKGANGPIQNWSLFYKTKKKPQKLRTLQHHLCGAGCR